jgi:hypothetical protein
MSLGFETRIWAQGLSLLGRCSTMEAMAPDFFALALFQVGSPIFGWRWSWLEILLSMVSYVAGSTGVPPLLAYSMIQGLTNFFPKLASNQHPPEPTSWIPGIKLFWPILWSYISNLKYLNRFPTQINYNNVKIIQSI